MNRKIRPRKTRRPTNQERSSLERSATHRLALVDVGWRGSKQQSQYPTQRNTYLHNFISQVFVALSIFTFALLEADEDTPRIVLNDGRDFLVVSAPSNSLLSRLLSLCRVVV